MTDKATDTAKETKMEVEFQESSIELEKKFASLKPLLERKSAFAPSAFEPGLENLEYIASQVRILVVGAGGLGCEILKDLALSGFTDIHVIDMDTIDVSNLNRQFLFRKKDTGKYKATCAAEFIMKRCKGVKVTPYNNNIMDYSKKWYKKFNLVIAGLDNIKARDWLNKTLIDMVEFEDGEVNWDTVIPLIDGGTTGFAGQARVVVPYQTACYHCTLASLPPEEGFHLCTIASKPRKPEHCIAYVYILEWPLLEEFKDHKTFRMRDPKKSDNPDGTPVVEEGKVTLDKDNPEHLRWILNRATQRAKDNKIAEPNYNMTMQVVKNIIPAIASTNAVIAASCVNEAWKHLARSHPRMNSYHQFYGHKGVSCETFPYKRDKECDVCSDPISWKMKSSDQLKVLVEKVKTLFPVDEEEKDVRAPSLSLGDDILYIDVPGQDYTEELNKPLFAMGIKEKSLIIATNGSRTKRVLISYK